MKRTKGHIISIIMAVLVLLTVLTVAVSAADTTETTTEAVDLISLKISDENVVITPPTVTPAEAEYGITYSELTYTGGSITYMGNPVSGYFTYPSSMANTKLTQNSSGTRVRLCFVPTGDDANIYAATNNLIYVSTYAEKYGEIWPMVIVNPVAITVEGIPAEMTVAKGAKLEDVAEIAAAKIYGTTSKEEITGGTWSWCTDAETETYENIAIMESGEYKIRWNKYRHESFYATVNITVDASLFIGIEELPEVTVPAEYEFGMTRSAITLEGGTAMYLGTTVAGHFEWVTPDESIASYLGTQNTANIVFVPDDEALVETFSTIYGSITVQMPAKRLIELAEDSATEIVLSFHATTDGTRATTIPGLKFKGIEAEAVFVSFSQSFYYTPVGLYENISMEMYISNKTERVAFESLVTEMPVRIIPTYSDGDFGKLEVKENRWGAEGQFQIKVKFPTDGHNGTVTVRVNDEIIADNLPPSYTIGEREVWHSFEYIPETSDEFLITAEYVPGPQDGYIYSNNILSATYSTIVREKAQITLVNATQDYEGQLYVGDNARFQIDYVNVTESNLSHWTITDANGNAVPYDVLEITENDLTRKYIRLTIPEYEIIIAAHKKGEITNPTDPVNPGEDPGDNEEPLTFWQKLINFFISIRDWFVNIFQKIAAIF